MLEDLQDIAVDQPRGFGPFVFGYRRETVQMHIDKIRSSLPLEIKQASNLTRESERLVEQAREDAAKTMDGARIEASRIVEEAKAEAERVLAAAKLEQERMLGENEILKIAKATADEIRSSADRDSAAMRRGAEDYAYSVLGKLETVVGRVMTTIDKGKDEIRPQPELAVVPSREKARV